MLFCPARLTAGVRRTAALSALLLALIPALRAGGQPPNGGSGGDDAPPPLRLPDTWLKTLPWRGIGPANMGGRITDIAVNPRDSSMFWVATASGGLLKTVNNGTTFEHQFDREATVSIGAVAVAPSNPEVVWVGTGENNPRNSVSYGDGVYRSLDGGKSWKRMGLERTYQIGKIVIHPRDPNTVYVGALGRLYGSSPDRGVYKTTDGGATWQKVLYVDDRTGGIDLRMHPTQPETLIAALWERRRDGFDSWPGTEIRIPEGYDGYDPIQKYGSGSGLYRTDDGGKSWNKVTTGLPSSRTGRIGIDWQTGDPNVVYAVVDCENIGKGPAPLSAFLGITGEDRDGRAVITQVVRNSPADRAGLRTNDQVNAVDGQAIPGFDAILDRIRLKKPGESVALTIERAGAPQTIEASLTARPGSPTGGTAVPAPAGAYMGIVGEDAEAGIRLTQVTEDGPAEKAGLRAGDLILTLDGQPLTTYPAFVTRLRAGKAGEKLRLTRQRGTEQREVTVTLEDRPGTPPRSRPYTFSYQGQLPNVQDQQGARGFEYGGVFRSNDAGLTWSRVNSLNVRPMYFSVVRVDPSDSQRVYLLGVTHYRSADGGATFTPDLGRGVHADGHALWIDPHDGRHMLIGVDGGVYVTYDRGANWDHLNHMAIGQFYHVAISATRPYRLTGGLQDNGTWLGPSQSLSGAGPINEDWISVSGGDGFMCRVDAEDPHLVYYTTQNGNIRRRNLRTGAGAAIRPQRPAGAPAYRFNWNTPFILSSHSPRVFYAAGNYVFQSTQRGDNLRAISPEITRTKRGSATALAESPRDPRVLYVGTDDGHLWVTRDGGEKWSEISKRLELPGPRWVATIEPSRTVEGRVYVALDGHRSDDDEPYLFASEDFGQTWRSLRANLPLGSTRCLREDLFNPSLLYLGTEFGAWCSLDRGISWNRLGTTLPTVAVHELAQHPENGELVAATHGRSLWICDVGPLRQIRAEHLTQQPALYRPSPVVRWRPQPSRGGTNRRFVGTNPAAGGHLYYALPAPAQKVSIRITDIEGNTIRELSGPVQAGLHRVTWDLMRDAPLTARRAGTGRRAGAAPQAPPAAGDAEGSGPAPSAPAPAGPAPNGAYRVTLAVDGTELSQTLTIIADPNYPPAEAFGEAEGGQEAPTRIPD